MSVGSSPSDHAYFLTALVVVGVDVPVDGVVADVEFSAGEEGYVSGGEVSGDGWVGGGGW